MNLNEACAAINAMDLRSITATMKRDGIRGVPGDCFKCIVARWLQQQTGLNVAVETMFDIPADGVYDKKLPWCAYAIVNGESVQLSNTVYRFLTNFDIGKYPKLEVGNGS